MLAAALDRIARRFAEQPQADAFCYADTHAGPGIISLDVDSTPLPTTLSNQTYSNILDRDKYWPGSWIVATRVLHRIFSASEDYELDVNDISPQILEQAKYHYETGRLRLWRHDWFKFLRDRLAMARPPNFVFIDPPDDDPRGPDIAVNAALLLDTIKCPYVLTTCGAMPQNIINLIGRTAVELCIGDLTFGSILGGGAETVLLSLLPDLELLAKFLNGTLAIHSPRNDDYTI